MSPSRPAPSSPTPAPSEAGTSIRCPGCGAVLVPAPGDTTVLAGAAPACTRLFEETLRGLREEATADVRAAAPVALADAAYTAQHPGTVDPERLREVLDDLTGRLGDGSPAGPDHPAEAGPPPVWRSTIADVAADLDVIDLPVLVETWARAVLDDWSRRGDARD